MGVDLEVTWVTVSICAMSVAVAALSELFIMQPLFAQRVFRHEHRSALLNLVLLFVGIGSVPLLYSLGFTLVFLYPSVGQFVDPALKCIEAIALLLFWHMLVTLAGGRERAALCVETSAQGPACVLIPFASNCALCRFRDGARALRFWQLSCVQWVVVSPIIRVMAQNPRRTVRLAGVGIQVCGLLLMLRALLDTHRGTRHAAPRHARPDAQFIVIKAMVLVLLVQTTVYGLGWPPPGEPPETVTRAFAIFTAVEMAAFSLVFAWAFGPHTLWWALNQTPLTHALTDAVSDHGSVCGAISRAGSGYNGLERTRSAYTPQRAAPIASEARYQTVERETA